MRRAGATFQQIGDKLGITRQAAHLLVTEELKEIAEETRAEADELRTLEAERLDLAMRAIVGKVKTGDKDAVSAWIRLSESRRKLLGLDAPTQAAVSVTGSLLGLDGLTEEEIDRRIAGTETGETETPVQA